MYVLKFGGTSLARAERILGALKIVQDTVEKQGAVAMVVSAFGGVTDSLLRLGSLAAAGGNDWKQELDPLLRRHRLTLAALLGERCTEVDLAVLEELENELRDLLKGIALVRECSARTRDLLLSFGERFSALVVFRALRLQFSDALLVDTRDVVRTDDRFGMARVDRKETNRLLRERLDGSVCAVVTGFIGSTLRGETTTLGRNGSDFTASLVGAAVQAPVIEIWTDVDGVLTADPGRVQTAFSVPEISYEEAMELSHFGASVIYPPSLQPALAAGIPLVIRNTLNPEFAGTRICAQATPGTQVIRGLSSLSPLALLRVQGPGMVGIVGVAGRLFGALARAGVNIVLITQASSEHSICFAVREEDADEARSIVEREFELEIEAGRVATVVVETELAVVAAVGENMRRIPGIAGRFFKALGREGVNVISIAQGSSELNISVVIQQRDVTRALNAVHDAFFLSERQNLNIFLVGTGKVASTFIRQLHEHREHLRGQRMEPRLVGVMNRRQMLITAAGIALDHWQQELSDAGETADLQRFVDQLLEIRLAGTVFVDCTAADGVGACYERLLNASVAVVTPNKRANAASLTLYKQIRAAADVSNAPYCYETTVGAGLPVISTLRDLLASGDRVICIEGVLSGTLSYLFNSFSGDPTFSALVRKAWQDGLTEPDPRDDLSGSDVGRKLLILGREFGLNLEPDDVVVENLVPADCREIPDVEDFLSSLAAHDGEFKARLDAAVSSQGVLRYVARVDHEGARVSLEVVGPDHPLFSLSGSDNMISFTTSRYNERPLVVKGPGAGTEVTAAGILADIVRASRLLV